MTRGKSQSLPSKIPFRRCANPVGTSRAMAITEGGTIPVRVRMLYGVISVASQAWGMTVSGAALPAA